jgi:hypothetical protein
MEAQPIRILLVDDDASFLNSRCINTVALQIGCA